MKYYVCKTVRLLNYLSKRFDVIKVDRDRNNKDFIVFLFEDSVSLRSYLRNYNN